MTNLWKQLSIKTEGVSWSPDSQFGSVRLKDRIEGIYFDLQLGKLYIIVHTFMATIEGCSNKHVFFILIILILF